MRYSHLTLYIYFEITLYVHEGQPLNKLIKLEPSASQKCTCYVTAPEFIVLVVSWQIKSQVISALLVYVCLCSIISFCNSMEQSLSRETNSSLASLQNSPHIMEPDG
jgi:hypothetical protein